MNLGLDDTITFREEKHQYFDKSGTEYSSVTRTLGKLKVPFDREGISKVMAVGLSKEKGITVAQAQAMILSDWDARRDSSIDRGLSIHGALEDFLRTGVRNNKYDLAIDFVHDLVKPYYRYYPEVIFYNSDCLIAGQADLVCQRQKSQNSIYDFYDYKTNEAKGIQYDSIGRKSDELKHYNRFFLPPLEFMEDCNFNLYALQLSMYAWFAQVTYGINVGKLGIIFIDNDFRCSIIPVPYLKPHVIAVVDFIASLHSLPQAPAVKNSDDDW